MADLAARIRELRSARGPAILLAEQNLAFARVLTGRVVLIDSGQIVFTGDWDAFDLDANLAGRHLAL